VVSVGSAIYVLGGDIGEATNPTESALKFDVAHGVWSRVTFMPEVISEFATCAIGTDIYVFGGINAHGHSQASVFKYSTEANAWSVLAPMPTAEYGLGAILIEGLIYIIGIGIGKRGCLRFEPVTGAWSTLSSTLHGHCFAALFVSGSCLYAAGGIGSLSAVERYDAATDTSRGQKCRI
jgi:hypothetical protein